MAPREQIGATRPRRIQASRERGGRCRGSGRMNTAQFLPPRSQPSLNIQKRREWLHCRPHIKSTSRSRDTKVARRGTDSLGSLLFSVSQAAWWCQDHAPTCTVVYVIELSSNSQCRYPEVHVLEAVDANAGRKNARANQTGPSSLFRTSASRAWARCQAGAEAALRAQVAGAEAAWQ